MKCACCWVVLAGCLLGACDDGVLRAFEPHAAALGGGGDAAEPNAEAGGGRGGTTSVLPVAGTGNALPTSPLLIDDFEDGDSRSKEPLGWWYPVNDKTSAQGFGIEPVSGGTANVYALRTHGSGFRGWGAAVGVSLMAESTAVGVIMVAQSTPLNPRGYEEVCFLARVEADIGAPIQVHLLSAEEEHYIQGVSLSEAWTRHCLPLVDFIGPSEAPLEPDALIALQFFFPTGTPFAVWLDDVSLVP
jgi:hypothetical protein